MPQPARQPCFLPLTVAAADALPDVAPPAVPDRAAAVRRQVRRADAAAAECWAALLADCRSPGRAALADSLGALADAAASYAGSPPSHRARAAAERIGRAAERGDGEQFAGAFVGFDQAVATAVAGAAR